MDSMFGNYEITIISQYNYFHFLFSLLITPQSAVHSWILLEQITKAWITELEKTTKLWTL